MEPIPTANRLLASIAFLYLISQILFQSTQNQRRFNDAWTETGRGKFLPEMADCGDVVCHQQKRVANSGM